MATEDTDIIDAAIAELHEDGRDVDHLLDLRLSYS